MSVVPEVITANHCGMQVLGVACVTNMAAGVLPQALDHAEVMATAERVPASSPEWWTMCCATCFKNEPGAAETMRNTAPIVQRH